MSVELTRAQEKALDKMLAQKGIDKQRFIAEQLAQRAHNASEQQKLRHPCVLRPRDPVTGAPAEKSLGPFGPHLSARLGNPVFRWLRKRRLWVEVPVVVHLFPGTRHHYIMDGSKASTMWASCEVR